jgi:hypothetical protein
MMRTIRNLATEAGFATASVEVNGNDVSFADPAGLLESLWRTLAMDGPPSPTPTVDLHLAAIAVAGQDGVEEWIESYGRVRDNVALLGALERRGMLDEVRDFAELLTGCSRVTVAEAKKLLASRVPYAATSEGDPVVPRRPVGHRVEDRAGEFFDCIVGYAALADQAGKAGLVITLDEFEIESAGGTSSVRWQRIDQVIDECADRLRGASRGNSDAVPLAFFIASAGNAHSASDRAIEDLRQATNGSEYELEDWRRRDFVELAARVGERYRQAYGEAEIAADDLQRLATEAVEEAEENESGAIRRFIRSYVALLDANCGPRL